MLFHLGKFFKNRIARAIGIIFACSGLVFGSWASFIPYLKDKFDLDEAQLGMLLLSMPIGVFVVNPVSVVLIRKIGAIRTAIIFAILTAFAFLASISFPLIPLVVIGLFLSGAFFGITNVSMNTCASALEESGEIRLISSCHGMWSLGAMVGALSSGLSLIPFQNCCGNTIAPQVLYLTLQAIFVCVVVLIIKNDLFKIHEPVTAGSRTKLNWMTMKPNKQLWTIISICVCTYLVEGTITDWSSVFLRDVNNAAEHIAGRGFAVYACFMAAGRFMGDDLIAKFGSMRVLKAGGILSLAGLIIIILSTSYLVALPGFMLVGSGISLASPILYQASAKVKGLEQGIGLATMNMFAMASFLGGPVLIGFIAHLFNLRIAFSLVAFATFIWILQTKSKEQVYKSA